MITRQLLLILAALIAVTHSFSGFCQDESYGSGKNFALNFYQKHISAAHGKSCPMHPSCSQYAKLALAQKLPVEAYLLIMERLQQCGQDIVGNYRLVHTNGLTLAHDPLDWKKSPYFSPVDIDQILPLSLDDQFAFPLADSLYHTENFATALLEYQRLFLHHEGEAGLQVELGKRIAHSYYQKGDVEKIPALFELKIERWPERQDLSDLFNFLIAKHHFKNSEFNKTKSTLSLMSDEYLHEHKIFLSALCHFYQDQWEQGLVEVSKINHPTIRPYAHNFLTMQPQYEQLKLNHPGTAGFLSAVVPGTGFLVSKKPGTAITSFIINGLFIGLTYEAIRKENYALAGVSGFFGLGWYFGSIRGSAKSVRKMNKKRKLDFLVSILNHHKSSSL